MKSTIYASSGVAYVICGMRYPWALQYDPRIDPRRAAGRTATTKLTHECFLRLDTIDDLLVGSACEPWARARSLSLFVWYV